MIPVANFVRVAIHIEFGRPHFGFPGYFHPVEHSSPAMGILLFNVELSVLLVGATTPKFVFFVYFDRIGFDSYRLLKPCAGGFHFSQCRRKRQILV
jgi:hypothetical protein